MKGFTCLNVICLFGLIPTILIGAESKGLKVQPNMQMCGGCGCGSYPSQGPMGPSGPIGAVGATGATGPAFAVNYAEYWVESGTQTLDLTDPIAFSDALSSTPGFSIDGTGTIITVAQAGVYYINYTIVHEVSGSVVAFAVLQNGVTFLSPTVAWDQFSTAVTTSMPTLSKGGIVFMNEGDTISLTSIGADPVTIGGIGGIGASLTIFQLSDLP